MPLLPRELPLGSNERRHYQAPFVVPIKSEKQVQIGAIMPSKATKTDLPVGADEPTDAETDQGDEIEVAPIKRMGEVLRIIHGFDQFVPPTDEEIRARMLQRKLTAKSADELLAGSEAEPLETFFGEPIMIHDYDIVESAEQYDQPVFFVLNITHKDTPHTVTTGAVDVMESVAIAKGQGFLPMMCVADRATVPTKNGFYPVKLRRFNPGDEPF